MKRIAVFLCTALLTVPAFADELKERYDDLINKVGPSIVTVKAVVTTEMNFGGQGNKNESRDELQGVVVRANGMIMMSNGPFQTRDFGADAQIKRTPTELKVIIGDEEKEYDAELVATDSKLNLAFVRIKDLEGRSLDSVSFADAAKADVGDRVTQVSRLEKGYDYATYVRTARVNGRIKKPRKAMMLDGTIHGQGLPVFTMQGEVVGVLSTIESGMSDDAGGNAFFMFGGGGGGRSFVLPGKVIDKLIEQAEKQANDMAAEKAKDADDSDDADESDDPDQSDESDDEDK